MINYELAKKVNDMSTPPPMVNNCDLFQEAEAKLKIKSCPIQRPCLAHR